MFFKILFPMIFVSAFWLLVKSAGKAMKVYGGKKVELPAEPGLRKLTLTNAGTYEIAIKRNAVTGTAPAHIAFKVLDLLTQNVYEVHYNIRYFESGKDASGSRTIPVATFTVPKPGDYQLTIPQDAGLKQNDKFIIKELAGTKGIVAIISIVFSSILLIAALVLSILAFLNKLS